MPPITADRAGEPAVNGSDRQEQVAVAGDEPARDPSCGGRGRRGADDAVERPAEHELQHAGGARVRHGRGGGDGGGEQLRGRRLVGGVADEGLRGGLGGVGDARRRRTRARAACPRSCPRARAGRRRCAPAPSGPTAASAPAAPAAAAGSGASVRSASNTAAASAARSTDPWPAGSGSVGTAVNVTPAAPRSRSERARASTWSRSAPSVVRAWPSAGRSAATRRQVEQAGAGQRRAEHGGQHLLLAFDAPAARRRVARDGRGPHERRRPARPSRVIVPGLGTTGPSVASTTARGVQNRTPESASTASPMRVEVEPDVAGDREAGQLLHGAGGAARAAQVECARELGAGLRGHGLGGVGGGRGVVALAGRPG